MAHRFSFILGVMIFSAPVFSFEERHVDCTVAPSLWSQLAGDIFISKPSELSPKMLDIFHKSGIRPRLVPLLPQRRAVAMHAQGEIDIVMATLIFSQTETVPSIPILDISASIAVKSELKTPPQLIAVSDVMVAFNHTILDAVKKDYKTIIVPEKRALRMLRDDEVDAILVGSILFWNKQEVDLGEITLKQVEQPNMPKFSIYFTFSKTSACMAALDTFNPHLQTALDAGLKHEIERELQINAAKAIKAMLH